MTPFEYSAPLTLIEALEVGHRDNVHYLAGGTDLLVKVKHAQVRPELLVDLKAIPELVFIQEQDGGVVIGSLTTIRAIETSAIIREKLPILAEAAGLLGSVQVRHRATIGGNLCNAAPSAETAPALLCLEALVEIVGLDGTRRVPIEDFFVGSGRTVLRPAEIVSKVIVPPACGIRGGGYYKLSVRKAMDIAFVGVAVYLELAGTRIEKVRIALGAVAPTPIRAKKAEAMLGGERLSPELATSAGLEAARESSPISDLRASAEYRREMVGALTKKGLLEAYARALAATGKEFAYEDHD